MRRGAHEGSPRFGSFQGKSWSKYAWILMSLGLKLKFIKLYKMYYFVLVFANLAERSEAIFRQNNAKTGPGRARVHLES